MPNTSTLREITAPYAHFFPADIPGRRAGTFRYRVVVPAVGSLMKGRSEILKIEAHKT